MNYRIRTMRCQSSRIHLASASLGVLAMLTLIAGTSFAQNEIVTENLLTGNPSSEWDISGAGDGSIQGFATDMSVDQGQTIDFKINTPSTDYKIDIYRLGYYGGMGARLVATIQPSAALPQVQPTCVTDVATGNYDCGNWTISASWAVPVNAVSGIYIARPVREDVGGDLASHIAFVVRDDDGNSDILMSTSDATWQAYNREGGNSLYTGAPAGRAYVVSYNRPVETRSHEAWDWVFNAEYPMVRWLERNGYDVSYFTNVDTERNGAEMLEHNVFLSVGHDEYWSGPMRANTEAARDAGVHIAFLSGNEVYWKTRYENSIDGNGTPYRTLVCYKESGSKIDPNVNSWTGLWRDGCAFTPPADGCDPENSLSGQISWTNAICGGTACGIEISDVYKDHRFWRNTDVATLGVGQSITTPPATLGYEWDPQDAGFFSDNPDGLVHLSNTNVGGLIHKMSLYRAPSGALVFGAGTVQWAWGLDDNHTAGPFNPVQGGPVDLNIQQATVDFLAEMGAFPETQQIDLIAAAATGDVTGPITTITSPADASQIGSGLYVITGTGLEVGGGLVIGVQISLDGGLTWEDATGADNWTYNWNAPVNAGQVTILSRGFDDLSNMEIPGPGVTVDVGTFAGGGGQPIEIACGDNVTLPTPEDPILVLTNVSQPGNPYGCYLTEILRGEGLTQFQHAEVSVLMADIDPLAYLNNYDIVIMGETALSTAEEQHIRDYVSAGGNLIAMRPDSDLADLFGMTFVGARAEVLLQYFSMNTISGPGLGLYSGVVQYHGEADDYTLAGGTELATLYDDKTTPSTNPAVVQNVSGSGQAVAFTFDLAKNIVLMRQGNPAWKDLEGDGVGGYRPSDLFRNGGQDYNDPALLPVPQADEEQRFLANLIMDLASTPLPRMWYLPDQKKSLVVNTGDGEGGAGASLEPPMDAVEARGGFFTHYLRDAGISGTSVAVETDWLSRGHETGVHMYGGGPEDLATLTAAYAAINGSLISKFGHGSRTARQHTIDWTGWSEMAEIEADNGTGLDCNYYHIPYYLGDPIGANGYFTGSGLPQRFSDASGTLIGIHQALTNWPDEWFANSGLSVAQAFGIVQGMIDAAETNGYYSAFVNNIHPVRYNGGDITSGWADQLWDYCQANNIPLWSAEMLLDFTEARNNSEFDNINWATTAPREGFGTTEAGMTLTFDFSTPTAGHALTLMVPASQGGNVLLSLSVNSIPIVYATETIKGRDYALFNVNVTTAQVTATYGVDMDPPILSNVRAESITDVAASILWDSDEQATSKVHYGTVSGNLTLNQTVGGFRNSHNVPLTGLPPNTLIYYQVESEDQAGNPTFSGELSFATLLPLWKENTLADFSLGTHTNTEAVAIGNGAVRLGAVTGFFDDFPGTSLDLGKWNEYNHFGSVVGPVVGASTVTLTGGDFILSIDTFQHVTVEGLVTLNAGSNAHWGIGSSITTSGPGGVPDPQWLIFTVKNSTQFQARTRMSDGQGEVNTVLPGVTAGVQHLLKIIWYPDDTVEFYVDGNLEATHARNFAGESYRVLASSNSSQSVVMDHVTVSGTFATAGTYQSAVFDAGGTSNFADFIHTTVEPAGTVVSYDTRTSLDNITYTAWAPLVGGNMVGSPDGQYIQYRANLSTTDDSVSPHVEQVCVSYDAGADATPPVVVSTDPADLATAVAVGGDITINYNEPINTGTFAATISGGITHTTSFSNGDATVVLNPDTDLGYLTAYTVTISIGVEDVSGNPTTSAAAIGFTTEVQPTCETETTVAEFSDGTLTDTEITSVGDGEVQLTSGGGFVDDFTEPDGPATNWEIFPPSGGGPTPTWNVSSNMYLHDFNAASSTYHPSMLSLANSPQGDLILDTRQRIVSVSGGLGVLGLVIGAQDTENYYFIQWAQGQSSVRMFKRVTGGGFTQINGNQAAGNPVNGTWYDIRVEVTGTTFNFYIDNVLTFTASDGAYTPGRIGLLAYQGSLNEYDDVVVSGSGVTANGTYESNVIDLGSVRTFTTMTWTGSEPANTTVGLETRSSLDNILFSPYEAVGGGDAIASPDGQYVQYRLSLASTDGIANPVVEEVDVCHVAAPTDVTPPVISNLLADPQPDGSTVFITWDTDEPATSLVEYGEDPGPLDQSESDVTLVTSHSATLLGLQNSTLHNFRVTSEDVATNSVTEPILANPAATFTTATPALPACFTDDLTADFALGTFSTTYLAETDDGEVILSPADGSEIFGATLPAGWAITPWTGSSSVVVSGGVITVEQSNVGPTATYGIGTSMEFVATFTTGESNQHVGFGTTFSSTPWAMFSLRSTDPSQLWARTYDGSSATDIPLGAASLDAPHVYRIDWNTDNTVDFYIDGALVNTQSKTIATNMSFRISDISTGPSLVIDWMRVSPYSAASSFESRIFDAAAVSSWDAVNWTSTEPTGTTLDIYVRTGNTAVPDGSWSAYSQILSNGGSVGQSAQFVQYRADMATSDPRETPVLHDLEITCDLGADTSPPIVTSTDPVDLAIDVALDTDITIDYNEPINTGTFGVTISGGVTFSTTFINGDATVVLNPDVDLAGLTPYTVTINAGVEDLNSNPTVAPHVFGFTTGAPACLTETSVADFSAGTLLDVETAAIGDGAVILSGGGMTELLNDTFTEADGPASNWTAVDGAWNIVSGEYSFTIGSSYALSIPTGLSPVDFVLESRQKIVSHTGTGAGGYVWRIQNPTAGNWKNGSYMLQWDTNATNNVRIFRWTGGGLTTLGSASVTPFPLGSYFTFRLVVSGAQFDLYIPEIDPINPIVSGNDNTYATGELGLSGWTASTNRYDDVVLTEVSSGFSANGTYTSAAVDGGSVTDWIGLTATTNEPVNTSIDFETRTSPDAAAWTAWEAVVANVVASPDDQYIQYRANLATTDPGVTPELLDLTITCDGCTDVTAPGAIADLGTTQEKSGTPAGSDAQTTAIHVSWSGAEPGADVSVYRRGFGDYPEYDDGTGSTPSAPVDPAAAITEIWTLVGTTTGNSLTDTPSTRDFWYYVAFVTDECGNVSAVSNQTGGALNYHLGDVTNGTTPGTGDNTVVTSDISALGASYGSTDGGGTYQAYLDVGPTEDTTIDGRPSTDDAIQFEDLIITAINYGQVASPEAPPFASLEPSVLRMNVPTVLPGIGQTFNVVLDLESGGGLVGLSVALEWNRSVVEPIGYETGSLFAGESSQGLVLSPTAGVVDAAALGSPIQGQGELARVQFRVLAVGVHGIAFGDVIGRDGKNRDVTIDFGGRGGDIAGDPTPSVTRLMLSGDNPFRSRTTIGFDLATPGRASIQIYSVKGRVIRTLVNEMKQAGSYRYTWNGRDEAGREVASGVYLIRFTAPGHVESRSVVRIR